MAGMHFNNSNGVREPFAVDDVVVDNKHKFVLFARSGNLELELKLSFWWRTKAPRQLTDAMA